MIGRLAPASLSFTQELLMPSRSLLKQLRHLDRSSSEFRDQLVNNVLYGEEYKQWIPTIQRDDLVGLIDHLDKVRCRVSLPHSSLKPSQALDDLDPASSAFRKCLHELRHVCNTGTIFPLPYTLSPLDLAVCHQPVASGDSCGVYEGSLNGSRVCVKRVRIYTKDGPKKAIQVHFRCHHIPAYCF
jgi:hypothetical protein